ncbi:diaminopropionate ammonia-lyase [Limibaculum sp. M0105]|uniref:Diaminopropionate ammonia-lyase n=1 Tax=Thermohalobaculum xanthum TaxID=2753746 RepID=A0A8J7SC58_9RHOB|nr:diaminopropionate ammonia-lyase [Thermohalobaculum xanthum]MBK0398056.1 diaminopropionate ammonia-lyase [Thermohalobaculum xanthum]
MTREILRAPGDTARPFALVTNDTARRGAPWTAAQDAILSDAAFETARATITSWPGYAPTPLLPLPGLAAEAGVASIHYKDEGGRFGLGSFKALGGAYAVARLLCREVSALIGKAVGMADILSGAHAGEVGNITVCCATDGNHGRSVAWGAQTFGCRCVIFIHATVSEGRKAAIEHYGAEVRRCAGNYDDSVREAQETATREGWFVVSDTSYPGYMEVPKDVMQGYELMAWEALGQLGEKPTHVFLQTGVGGMAAAVAAQAKRRWGDARPVIVLADPDRSACWLDSFRAGRPTAVEGDLDTLMAGLACGEVSALAWEILKDHADAAMALPDDAAVEMMRRLAHPAAGDTPVVAGESAVAGLAGLMAAMADDAARKALGLDAGSRILVFGTEGDTDPELYRALVGADAATIRGQAA